jgi:hypothetical protein
MGKTTPAVLANKVLRNPERLLLDVPLLIESLPPEQGKHKFLLDTEAELARIGKLQMRRQFILLFADVLKEKSKNSVKELTDFLFSTAPQEFRDTLEWGKRCTGAIEFLRLLSDLIEFLESRQRSVFFNNSKRKRVKQDIDTGLKKLEGTDKEVALEWVRLYRGLLQIIEPDETKDKEQPCLVFFQRVAQEVFEECLLTFHNIDTKRLS